MKLTTGNYAKIPTRLRHFFRLIPFFFLLLSGLQSFPQALQPVRPVWDGPFDIRMIGAPGLVPVFINKTEAGNNVMKVDSVIRQSVIMRTGDLLNINNQYKPFAQDVAIPPSAFMCSSDDPGCTLGLPTIGPNATCPVRYGTPSTTSYTVALSYPDFDTDMSTYSSSMAQLDIPKCAEIETAYLYWTGMFKGSNTAIQLKVPTASYNGSANVFNTGGDNTYTTVKLKVPGGSYQTITGTNFVAAGSNKYICRADITNQIRSTGAGQYWVGNLQTYPTEGGGGSSSGWGMVVVFKSPLSPPRTIGLWDGLTTVTNSAFTNINLTGLQAPATSNFKSYVGVGILDGDDIASEIVGLNPLGFRFSTDKSSPIDYNPLMDQPKVNLYNSKGYPMTCASDDNAYSGDESCKVPASTTCQAYDGLASSRITTYDEVANTNGNEIVRLPSNINTMAIDLHHIKLPDGAIGAGATQATLGMKVAAGGSNTYQLFLAYIAIERLQPKLVLNKVVDKDQTQPGGKLTYTLKVKNAGNQDSYGTTDFILDTLDPVTTYAVNSVSSIKYQNGNQSAGNVAAPTITSFGSPAQQVLKFSVPKILQKDSLYISFSVDVLPTGSALADNLYTTQCKRTIFNTAWVDYQKNAANDRLQSKSNSGECNDGSMVQVKIIVPNTPETDLGTIDASTFSQDFIVKNVRKYIALKKPASAADTAAFLIYDGSGNRVYSYERFPSGGSLVYRGYRDITTGGSCQEVVKITFVFCTQPILQITQPAAKCGGTFDLSTAIKPGSLSPATATLSYWKDTTATALGSSTVNVGGTYYVQPALANCKGKFYAINVVIDTLPNITVTNPAAVCAPNTVNITTSSVWTDAANSTPTITYHRPPAVTGSAIALADAQAIATSGTYYIKAVNGTCSDEKPVVVAIDPVPTFSLTAVPAQCLGSVDLSTKVAGLSPSTATLTYYSDSTKAAISSTVSSTGTYYVKATGPSPTSCETKYKYGQIAITISPVPTGVISIVNPQICNSTTATNNKATITLTFTGNKPFDFSYKGSGATGTQTVTSHNSLTYTFDVSTAETFNIVSLKETNGCTATDLGTTVTSSFFEDPVQIGSPVLECDPANTASGPFKFRVVFTGDKGDVASYKMTALDQGNGTIGGSFNGKVWTSDYVDESKKITLTFTDKNGCNPVIVKDLSRVCSRTVPDAGPDTTLCGADLPKIFKGNGTSVIAGETYRWKDLNSPSIVSPVEGDNNLVLPATTPQGTYKFEFSITNPVSGVLADVVEITVHKETTTPSLQAGYTGTSAAAPYKMCSSSLNLPGVANPDPAPLAKNWWTVTGTGSIPANDSTATPLLDNVSAGSGSGTFYYKNGVCPVKSVDFYYEKVGEVTPAAIAINGGKALGEGKQYSSATDSLQKMANKTADTLCLGGAYQLTTRALKADEVGTWSYVLPAGTSVAFGSGLNSPTQDLQVNGTGATQIKWSVKNSTPALANCPANELTVMLVVRDVPKDGSLNLASLCEGTDSTFTINEGTSDIQPVTYAWSDGSLGATRTGAASGLISSYKFESLAGSTEAKFFVTPSNRCGVGKVIRDSVKIKLAPRNFLAVPANPHDTTNGPLSFCATSQYTGYKLDGIQPNVTTYTWFWDGQQVGVKSDTARVIFDNVGRWDLNQSGVTNHTIRVELTNACSESAKKVGIMPLVKDTAVQIIGPSVVSVVLSSNKPNNQFCIPDDAVTFTATVTTNPVLNPFLTDYIFDINGPVQQGPQNTLVMPAKSLKDGDLVSVTLNPIAGQCIRTVGESNVLAMEGFSYPDSIIVPSGDTICERRQTITLTVGRTSTSKGTPYDNGTVTWYKDGVLLAPQPTMNVSSNRFQTSVTNSWETGKYVVHVAGKVCAHTSITIDTVPVKIYEQPVVNLPEILAVPYEAVPSYRMPASISGLSKDTLSYKEYVPATWLQDPNQINTLLIPEKEEKTIPYTLQVRTGPEGKGCPAEGHISVIYYLPINIPNAFSPNGDGKNETWVITGLGKYPNTHVKIYNRWGSSIYANNDGYKVPWDGTENGTLLASGTYYYIVELKGSPDATDGVRTGSLTIVR